MSEMQAVDPEIPGWKIVHVKARVDSFSQEELMNEIRAAKEAGERCIALNLRNNRFLSLPAIKCCAEIAQELRRNGGVFALVACSEKTKRHFEIYGTLSSIRIVRTERDLVSIPQNHSEHS